MAVLLTAEGLRKAFGTRVLFDDLNLTLPEGKKVGLIARNGTGKTSLIRILAGDEAPDKGKIIYSPSHRFAYLPQDPLLDPNVDILGNVLRGTSAPVVAARVYREAMMAHTLDHTSAAVEKELSRAMNLVESTDAWGVESDAISLLGELGIQNLDQDVRTLSGGQQKRVALAQVLLDTPDLLFLDEPTNHLDVEVIEWLGAYLSRSKMTLLLVTHDRYFLDEVCNEIIELERGTLRSFPGKYTVYLERKAEVDASEASSVDKAKNLLRKELEWMRRQPKARGTKQKAREDRFYETEKKANSGKSETGIELIGGMTRLGKKVLEAHHISKSFADKVLIKDFSYLFERGARIGIVGPNGVGKSTLLNILVGNLQPDKGHIELGETVVVGYYTQAGLLLREDKRALEVVTDIAEHISLADGSSLSASTLMTRFGFEGPLQHTFVSALSGGEKRRLYLLTLLIKNPNFLILDEPTNDLDIPTLRTLEAYLSEFGGCLLIVSHDRYFMDALVEHLFVFDGMGGIKDFYGNYTDYREHAALKPSNKVGTREVTSNTSSQSGMEPQKKASFKEKQEYESIEIELLQLDATKEDLILKLSSGGSADDIAKWAKAMNELDKTIAIKSDRWLALSELVL